MRTHPANKTFSMFLLNLSISRILTEKALFPQRMCTCAAEKGHEKSRGLIRVSVPGFVSLIQLFDPDKLEFIKLSASVSSRFNSLY